MESTVIRIPVETKIRLEEYANGRPIGYAINQLLNENRRTRCLKMAKWVDENKDILIKLAIAWEESKTNATNQIIKEMKEND